MMTKAEARACVERANDHFMKAGEHLAAARKEIAALEAGEGWRALGYATLSACVQQEFGYSRQHVHRLLTSIEIEQDLSPKGDILLTERLMRPLAPYSSAARALLFEFALAWADNNGVRLTAGIMESVVDALGEMITTATFTGGSDYDQLDLYDKLDAHITANVHETTERQKEYIRGNQRKAILSSAPVMRLDVDVNTCRLIIELPDNRALERLRQAFADQSLIVNLYEDSPESRQEPI